MKKIILQLVFLTLIFSGCSSDSNGGSANTCGNITDFTVVQNNEKIVFNLVASGTPLFYEVSVLNAVNSLDPEIGTMHIINNVNQSFTIADLALVTGNTYLFYIRTACSDGTKSAWTAPKTLTIYSFCYMPSNIMMNAHDLIWENNNTDSSQSQVEYGVQGFNLGSGILTQVTGNAYSQVAMQENLTYDFYVRTYCNASLGWSQWAGPYTYLCPANYNACNAPSNVGYTIERDFFGNATGASMHWNFNGETNFEYTMVFVGQSPSQGIINTSGQNPSVFFSLNQNTNYHFYVRAICGNGNRTNWAGPVLVNIGS